MKNISIFSFGRIKSQRCKNKMLRPFYDTTITDIVLHKLNNLSQNNTSTFFAGYEKEFKKKCNIQDVRFVKRDKLSTNIDGPIDKILSFLKNEKSDYFIIINACQPLLKINTINSFIKFVRNKKIQSAFTIKKNQNFYLDKNKNPLNFNPTLKTINTKKSKPIYEFSHSLYFFNKEFFFKNKKYWNWNDLSYFTIEDNIETIDIDTENDFTIAESVYKNTKKI